MLAQRSLIVCFQQNTQRPRQTGDKNLLASYVIIRQVTALGLSENVRGLCLSSNLASFVLKLFVSSCMS